MFSYCSQIIFAIKKINVMKGLRYSVVVAMMLVLSLSVFAQNENTNAASKLMLSDKSFTIGGYGQIDYNQPISNGRIQNGNLDIHRMVLLFGYRFNDRLNFVTEIEFEHVKEVYIEQAFLNYSFSNYLQVRGGLMLVPMGIINEYHEPTTYNGVERPLIDKYIAPTTWREIGIGLTGSFSELSLKYQAYLMNGFSSYGGSGLFSGKSAFRGGRQKGIESIIKTPVLASRVEYFGVLGLNVGLSAYIGKTQSSLFKDLDKNKSIDVLTADSSIVSINMFGFDAQYEKKGFKFRGQLYYSMVNNTYNYNVFTSSDNTFNDLGKSQYGYYVEVSYDVFHKSSKIKSQLLPFVRYTSYDTQYTVEEGINKNPDYEIQAITAGFGWKPVAGVIVKTDMQFSKSASDSEYNKVFNAGIGVWF